MQPGRDNFRYLNREGKWLDFHWRGLEVTPQGELQLLASPRLADQVGAPAAAAAGGAPHVPGGIAVDETGRVFYSVPGENRIVVVGGCEPAQRSLEGLTEGAGLGALSAPRGLLVLSQPERLVVADSGNDRLLFFDLREFDVREVWGEGGLGGWPPPEDAPDRFRHPWVAAADSDGQNIYVLDAGNDRVLKFARTGEADAEFLAGVEKHALITSPRALAVAGRGAGTRLFVYDHEANTIFVFDRSGAPVLDSRGWPVSIRWPGMGNVLALVASENTLYVGDNDQQRILSFRLSEGFPFSGEAVGFRRHVTALAVDERSGALLVQTGDGSAQPLSLEAAGAYLASGVLWSDAIQGGASPVAWGRLRASVVKAPGSHIEFYYAVSNDPAPPPVDPAADDPFGDACWRALPQDVEDFLLGDDKGVYLFVGARLSGDRGATLRLKQLRADFDTESYVSYLPAIYREPAGRADFLKRLVSLFQGLFEDIEDEAEALERYFDTSAAPAEGLAWLATWLAVELSEGEPEARVRESIARAFRRYQWRGTIEGLRLALLEDAGVHATISEPIAAGSFWAMPRAADCGGGQGLAPSPLGAGTHLSSTEPGGAVLGMTAELDHSYLITDAQFGEPLFEGVAWQFVVEVYRGEVGGEARLQTVKEIIEREKPAHTMYRLVVLDSRMRVGAQARVGVDMLVGGAGGPTPLGQGGDVFGLRLGGAPSARVGVSRLGEDLKL
jgi:phage tail-like protein